ncbi:MAG: DUF1905 domain-containing protein [Anaerolineaceae bacterium]|nr:DUF1905 domain-containing protein [Anaerolineaceae bacterium]MBN2678216.1 DUF1905 domain-containing protein [Anaerolineaceae bacterium]
MDKYEFDAIIHSSGQGGGAYILFTYDPLTCFGKKNMIPIDCTFDGISYRGSIANMGAGPCIGVLKAIRERLGKGDGESVHVIVWQDITPRMLDTPTDLAVALKDNPVAAAAWKKLSYSHKREHVEAITSAKRDETRRSRICKTIENLTGTTKS